MGKATPSTRRTSRDRRLRRVLAPLVVTLAVLGCVPGSSGEVQTLSDRPELRGFASWRELTDGPYQVDAGLWELCVDLPHPGTSPVGKEDRFIRVYANQQAHPLMLASRGPQFPVGSVIAKVKLARGSDLPMAVAFMVKREAGSDPAALDWEFLLFEGEPLRRTTGDASTCQGCHGAMKEGDGVFGSYLTGRQGQPTPAR